MMCRVNVHKASEHSETPERPTETLRSRPFGGYKIGGWAPHIPGPFSHSTPTTVSMLFFASLIFSTLTFSLLAPSVNAQTVVVTRRRSVGSIVAGCVVGGVFFLVILGTCCMMVSRRRARSLGGPSIEDPHTPNSNSGATGGGTRIVAVHSRPMFFGRRRGLFRGPRVIAMSSWGGAPTHQQQQQRTPAPDPSGDNPKADNTDFVTSSGATSPPPPYGKGQLEEDSLAKNQRVEKGETYAMSPTLNQPEQAHIKEEGSNFVGGFRP